jgi:hypothetical protein
MKEKKHIQQTNEKEDRMIEKNDRNQSKKG